MSDARAMVFAPTPLLTVTIESRPDGTDDVHLHAGGQGVWIARMLATLGLDTRLCGPFGGEAGAVISSLVERDRVRIVAAPTTGNGNYVHDRRSGERVILATTDPSPLDRHDLDELYNTALVEGLESNVAVLAGPDADDIMPPDTYRRLTKDLTTAGIAVVADLSGDYLRAVAAGGVSVLKVSHEDLVRDGHAKSDDTSALLKAMRRLQEAGAKSLIVTRAEQPALVLTEDRSFEVQPPQFEELDHHGAGDSLTAGVAAALARGGDLDDALRLGAAAGALNATRHGLATGERGLIERLTRHVQLTNRE